MYIDGSIETIPVLVAIGVTQRGRKLVLGMQAGDKEVGDDLHSIFYSSSKKKAMEFFAQFKRRWKKELPSAVKYLEKSIDSCLTFLVALKKNGFH